MIKALIMDSCDLFTNTVYLKEHHEQGEEGGVEPGMEERTRKRSVSSCHSRLWYKGADKKAVFFILSQSSLIWRSGQGSSPFHPVSLLWYEGADKKAIHFSLSVSRLWFEGRTRKQAVNFILSQSSLIWRSGQESGPFYLVSRLWYEGADKKADHFILSQSSLIWRSGQESGSFHPVTVVFDMKELTRKRSISSCHSRLWYEGVDKKEFHFILSQSSLIWRSGQERGPFQPVTVVFDIKERTRKRSITSCHSLNCTFSIPYSLWNMRRWRSIVIDVSHYKLSILQHTLYVFYL
jgi:hypothetical protein